MRRRCPHGPSETGYAADREFEFAWRNGRSFNRSITLPVIGVISCATAELRAMIVQLQRSDKDLAFWFARGVDRGRQQDFVDADGREFAS